MKRAKQITALIAIILLAGLYVATFIASFFSGFDSGKAFGVCLILTITIPLLAFIAILFFGRAAGKKVIGDPDEPESEAVKSAPATAEKESTKADTDDASSDNESDAT